MHLLLRKTVELTLIYSVPELTEAKSNSRLAGLERKLQKEAGKHLAKMPKPDEIESQKMLDLLVTWGEVTGWKDKKHIGSLVSFCAEMMEKSVCNYSSKLYEIITDIVDHLNNRNDFYIASIPAGALAAKRWIELTERN